MPGNFKGLLSVYIIFALITGAFVAIMAFEGLVDQGGNADAATITVDKSGGGDHTTISAAISAANSGDIIFVNDGTYNENLVIDKTLTLKGNGSSKTKITNGFNYIVQITAYWVNITGFEISGGNTGWGSAGVFCNNVKYCNISENVIYTSHQSIGIRLDSSTSVTVMNNNLSDNYYSIYNFGNCDGLRFINNTCNSNRFQSIDLKDSKVVLINNTVNNNGGYGMNLNKCSSSVVKDSNIKYNSNYGIHLVDSIGSTLEDNNVISNNYGIYVQRGSANKFIDNNVISNTFDGIFFTGSSSNNLNGNIVTHNTAAGIELVGSSGNTIQDCTANSNSALGIRLDGSSGNTIAGCNASFNGNTGLYLLTSDDNSISKSTFTDNTNYGAYLSTSDTNTLSACTFKDNYDGIDLIHSGDNEFNDNIFKSNSVRGLYLNESSWNIFLGNTITGSLNGVYLETSNSNIFNDNVVSNNEESIRLYNSKLVSFNKITCMNNDYGFVFSKSLSNTLENCTIEENSITDINMDQSSRNIIATNITFDTIEQKDSESELIVFNYLHIQVKNSGGSPVQYGEVWVMNGQECIYSTQGFGGSDKQTDHLGQVKWIKVMDKKIYKSNVDDPTTKVTVKKSGRVFRHNNGGEVSMANSHFEYFLPNNYPAKVTLAGPSNNSGFIETPIELEWNQGSDIDGDPVSYCIQIDEASGDWKTLVASCNKGVGELKWNCNEALADGSYKWRVCAFDGFEYGQWSDEMFINIDVDKPKANKPYTGFSYNNSGIITWKWDVPKDTGSGISGYYVYIGTAVDDMDVLDGGWTALNSYTQTGLKDGITYYCSIKAVSGAGAVSDMSQVSDGTTVDLNLPLAYKPRSGTTLNNSGAVKWAWLPSQDTGSGILGYYVSIGTTIGGNDSAADVWTSNLYYVHAGLLHGKTYFCTIKAKNGASSLSLNDAVSDGVLIDKLAPERPRNLVLTPGTWSTENSFTVSWENIPDTSGIVGAYYSIDKEPLSNDDGIYVKGDDITSISKLTVENEGEYVIYVWLSDRAGNANILNYSMNYIRYDGVPPSVPLDLKVEPSTWSSINFFTVSWTDPADATGIEVGAYYYIGSKPPKSQEDGSWFADKPFVLTDAPEGDNILYLWLKDMMGNSNFQNYKEARIKFDETEPSLEHTPVKSAEPEAEIIINVRATDPESGVSRVTLYFKQKSEKEYNEVAMERVADTFIYTIPSSFATGDGLEYYIKAEDLAIPVNTAYYGRSGAGDTEPTSSSNIDISIDKGDILSNGAFYILIAIIIIIIVLAVMFQFGYLKPVVNKILRREEEDKPSTTTPGEKRIIPSETQSYRSAPTVSTGAGTTAIPGVVTPAPQLDSTAPAALPEPSTKVYRKCPICSSMLTEETKCVYCGWNK